MLGNKTTNISYGHLGYDLDEIGDWIITYEIKDKFGNRIGSSNFHVNGVDINWFKVITLLEASLDDYNKITLDNNIQI